MLQHIHIHENEMTEAAAHDEEVEYLMASEIGRKLIKNRP